MCPDYTVLLYREGVLRLGAAAYERQGFDRRRERFPYVACHRLCLCLCDKL